MNSKAILAACLLCKSAAVADWTPDHDVVYRTLMGEAASEGQRGLKLVADTLVNRARRFHKGVSSPVNEAKRPWQYSMWNSAIKDQDFVPAVPSAPRYVGSIASNLTRQVINGDYEPTSEYTHYFNPNKVRKTPSWAEGLKGTRVGRHLFYSDIAPYLRKP